MRDLLRPMLPMIVVLAIPIVPFLLFGSRVEAWVQAWRQNPPATPIVVAFVVGLLVSDVFLPIPSSVISTLAGTQLGWLAGTVASWVGMTLGGVIGFAVARWFGPPLVARMTRPDDLAHTSRLIDRYGVAILILSRGVPVLAEATVLSLGMNGFSWRNFLPPVLLANLGLALPYAVFGEFAERFQILPAALAFAIALPVLLAACFRVWTGKPDNGPKDPN